MAITDYTSLQTAILAWLNRTGDTDAAAQVTTWIQLGEEELITELAQSPLRQCETVNASYTISSEYQALPTGFLNVRELVIQGTTPKELNYIAPNTVDRYSYLTGTQSKPDFYTIQGNQLRFISAPDASYTATFSYQNLSALSAINTTNALLTAHPKIYLNAALAEADMYYRDADAYQARTGVWKTLFATAYSADGPSSSASALQMRTDNGSP